MAVVTITGSDVSGGSPSGGGVGGASNLTTAGAVPYVASPGVLTQAATGLFYDSANVRLGVGTGAPVVTFQVGAGSGTAFQRLAGGVSLNQAPVVSLLRTGINDWTASVNNLGVFLISKDPSAGYSDATLTANAKLAIATTGNLLIGTTTDGNYKLDIAASGSSGTLRVYDQTATTGSTLLAVQAGAGQSTNNLQEWRNNAGTIMARVTSNGEYRSDVFATQNSDRWAISGGFANHAADYGIRWSQTNGDWSAKKDSGIARASEGVIEINNGTARTLRDLLLRYLQNTGVTVATLPAAAAGNAGSRAYVTDANATTIGTTVAGGGANKVMVWSDGTNWKIYAS